MESECRTDNGTDSPWEFVNRSRYVYQVTSSFALVSRYLNFTLLFNTFNASYCCREAHTCSAKGTPSRTHVCETPSLHTRKKLLDTPQPPSRTNTCSTPSLHTRKGYLLYWNCEGGSGQPKRIPILPLNTCICLYTFRDFIQELVLQ